MNEMEIIKEKMKPMSLRERSVANKILKGIKRNRSWSDDVAAVSDKNNSGGNSLNVEQDEFSNKMNYDDDMYESPALLPYNKHKKPKRQVSISPKSQMSVILIPVDPFILDPQSSDDMQKVFFPEKLDIEPLPLDAPVTFSQEEIAYLISPQASKATYRVNDMVVEDQDWMGRSLSAHDKEETTQETVVVEEPTTLVRDGTSAFDGKDKFVAEVPVDESQAVWDVSKEEEFGLKFTRPRGRGPKGKEWDGDRGIWVTPEKPIGITNHPRPRGRAPANKNWDPTLGAWVDEDTQLENSNESVEEPNGDNHVDN